ncbi:MAG: hydroxymethylbilane synthase [Abditibacteriaceae bacterium]
MKNLRLGTRGSALAITQSRHVAAMLRKQFPDIHIEEIIIRTAGDQRSIDHPKLAAGASDGKGIFTKEIEVALLNNEIDFAVHSQKDLPPEMPEGLIHAATPPRETAADSLVSKMDQKLEDLPEAARIGTSSLRRQSQLLHLLPKCNVLPLRGNIDTRLRKLDEGEYDAIVVAGAALERLNIQRGQLLDQKKFVPAPAQGALAIQIRADDKSAFEMFERINDATAQCEINAERAVVKALNAGCSTPLGARAVIENDHLHLWAVVLSPDGERRIFAEAAGVLDASHQVQEAARIGQKVAQHLLDQGAEEYL